MVATQGMIARRSFLGLTGLALLNCLSPETVKPAGKPFPNPGVGGEAGTGGDDRADDGVSSYQLETGYLELPCKYAADLDRHGGSVLALCTTGGSKAGDHGHLAVFDAASAMRPIPSSLFKDIEEVPGRFLNQVIPISEALCVVTANDGFYEVPLTGSGSPRFIPFPAGVTYGAGGVRVGKKLFLATANLNGSTYDAGGIQIYDLAADDSILENTRRSRATSRKNPTGFSILPDEKVMVVNSGDYTPGSQASLDFFNPETETLDKTVPLGTATLQNSGEAANEDGIAVLGTADGSGRVFYVDLNTGEIVTRTLSGTQFHSSVKISNGRVLVTDFNSGLLTLLDLLTGGVLQTFDLREELGIAADENVEAGPSEVVDGQFIQAIPYGAVRVYAV